MFDIEKASEFLKDIKENTSIEKIIKQKQNLTKLLNLILKQINNEIDLDSLNNLQDSQIWAFINNNSSKTINEFKSQLKNTKIILNELSEFNDALKEKEQIKEKKNLGKKTKREKENEEEEEENDMEEEMEEEEDEENIDDINNNKEDVNFGKQKDIFFSMKDLNNFADQFEEEDNNMNLDDNENDDTNKIKSAPNKLTISSSRKKSKLKGEDISNNNEEMEEDEDDENNSLYSEEQEIKAEIDSDEEIKYNKFFDKPDKKHNNKNTSDNSSQSDFDENEIFTQIKCIEEKMLNTKKEWSTKGEILGKERPKDSLLTKAMDFEVGLKAPPIPDKEFTDKLELMIKQRIIDEIQKIKSMK